LLPLFFSHLTGLFLGDASLNVGYASFGAFVDLLFFSNLSFSDPNFFREALSGNFFFRVCFVFGLGFGVLQQFFSSHQAVFRGPFPVPSDTPLSKSC